MINKLVVHCNIDVYVNHEDTNHYFAYFSKLSWDMFSSNKLFLISEGVKYSSSYSSFYIMVIYQAMLTLNDLLCL